MKPVSRVQALFMFHLVRPPAQMQCMEALIVSQDYGHRGRPQNPFALHSKIPMAACIPLALPSKQGTQRSFQIC